jgi:hypothetical protein
MIRIKTKNVLVVGSFCAGLVNETWSVMLRECRSLGKGASSFIG